MADPRTRRRALWLAEETTYATDPGSGYLAVPAMELGEIQDGKAVLETNRFTGRDGSTPTIAGPDSATFQFMLEALGFDAQVTDGVSPPAEDYFDKVIKGALGDMVERDGASVTSHLADALNLGAANDLYDVGDIIPLYDGTNTRWVIVTADNADGTYTVTDIQTGGFTGTLAPGCRIFRWDNGTDLTKTFTSVIDQDSGATGGQQYTLPGSKITSLSWAITPGEQAKATIQMFADGQSASSKAGLAAQTGLTATTPLRSACVYVDGTEIDTAQISIDYGLEAQPRESTCRENGRSEHLIITANPTITIQPVFTNDLLALKRNQNQRSVLVQLGTGAQSNAWFAPVCNVVEATRQDANGLQRIELQFQVRDAGVLADGSTKPRFLHART